MTLTPFSFLTGILTGIGGALLLLGCNSALSLTSTTTTTVSGVSADPSLLIKDHDASDDDVWSAGSLQGDFILGTSPVTIGTSGTYRFTGTLSDGQLVVNVTDTSDTGTVRIVLSGASLSCSTGPALWVRAATKVVVVLADGTTNTISDGTSYTDTSDQAPNAALYSEANLTIEGDSLNTGTLTVVGNAYDAITTKAGLVLKDAVVSVTAVDDGIRGKDYLVIRGGSYSVTSGGDGLISDNHSDTTRGYVRLESGTVTVASGGDGITASTFGLVSGGTAQIKSGGGSSATLATEASAKGIKAGAGVAITGGSLVLDACDDGIHADAGVTIGGSTSPSVAVTSGADGIQAEGALSVTGGTLTVTSKGDSMVGATVVVSAGTLALTSGGGSSVTTFPSQSAKGIKATSFALSGGDFTISSADDALHAKADGSITGGTYVLSGSSFSSFGAQGIKVGDTGTLTIGAGVITITKSFEGLAGGHLVINGGTLRVTATDDGLSVSVGTDSMSVDDGSTLKIHGGYLVVNAAGDGIDVNGSAVVTGGTILVNGPLSGQANAAVDFNGTFAMSGGILVAVGSSQMAQSLSSTSTQSSVLAALGSLSAGTLVHLQTSAGTSVVTFAPTKAYQSILFCSPSLAQSTSYSLYTGGSATGTVTDGLYTAETYTAGTLFKTFTTSSSSTVTTVGSGTTGGTPPGGR